MTTKLDIINTALSYVGQLTVNNLDVANPVIAGLSQIYDRALPDELAGHPWTFALKWAELTLSPEEPEDDYYSYTYYLPEDYITAWNTYPGVDYSIIADDRVYSNASQPWKWLYVGTVNESEFPGYFAKLMSLIVAAEGALLVTENGQTSQYLDGKVNAQRVIARNRDFTSQPNPAIRDNPIWSAHFV